MTRPGEQRTTRSGLMGKYYHTYVAMEISGMFVLACHIV